MGDEILHKGRSMAYGNRLSANVSIQNDS